MRIRSKVALVGGIPITIAAAIAATAWLLLSAADTARNGAVLAGAAYRDLREVMTARSDYIRALPPDRAAVAQRLTQVASSGLSRLDELSDLAREQGHGELMSGARDALLRYRVRFDDLTEITTGTDRLIAEIGTRAASLIGLTDRARERQHASNADIIASLTERDRRLRLARDIVDRAQELRAAIAAQDLQAARNVADGFVAARVRNSARDLLDILRSDGPSGSAEELASLTAGEATSPQLAGWVERLIKVNATEQRALHEEVAQLLTYTVSAAETEQATQNIAINVLKFERRAADALESRNVAAAESVLAQSRSLASTVGSLPISPLIQSDMIAAIESWREGLATTARGLHMQNEIINDLNTLAEGMIRNAAELNDRFTADAERIGRTVRTILLLGAAIGLLLGAGTALVVARSITQPLRRLQETMLELAANPQQRSIAEAERRDELGAMAKAVNFFVREISRREKALRHAKERADSTLLQLQETQTNLIQSEKLASLGQLVAGVAHEINTPLGVALTTSTTLEREVSQLGERAGGKRLTRSEFEGALTRLNEGSRLLLSNLSRAIDLVYSFKQVAADQASGERRRFSMKVWLDELLTSLGPVLRKSGHTVTVECPPDLVLDTYPGSLAQVVTNLVMNAIVHAYEPGRTGHLEIRVTERAGSVRLVFRDDGRGIAPDHLPRIFDPFFTTGRDRGSTGLGLHIVYNLVTARLGGTLDVDSRVGEGTCFTVDLPAAAAAEPARAPIIEAKEHLA